MQVEKSDLQLETIVSRIRADELDLQPDFQRGDIWDTRRRQRLVDTILRGWYVPAVHVVVTESGDELVLDGQQRLNAIRDFFDDKLKVDGSIEPRDQRMMKLGGLTYSQLPDPTRKAANRFSLTVVRLHEYDPSEPNELFFRLNQSYNLTPPEKRNALHGEARDQVKGLVEEFMELGLLARDRIGFSNGRLAYDDIVARTCVAVEWGDLRKHINNNVVEDFYRTSEFSGHTIEAVGGAGRRLLSQIQLVDNGRVRFNKGTLQTWLTYCAWAPASTGEALPDDLLATFEAARLLVKNGSYTRRDARSRVFFEIVAEYDDRASYRVTDVSSVLIRDLTLHLFSLLSFDTAPVMGSDDLLRRLLAEERPAAAALIGDFLTKSQWGAIRQREGHSR